jgi:hypothetical protein
MTKWSYGQSCGDRAAAVPSNRWGMTSVRPAAPTNIAQAGNPRGGGSEGCHPPRGVGIEWFPAMRRYVAEKALGSEAARAGS